MTFNARYNMLVGSTVELRWEPVKNSAEARNSKLGDLTGKSELDVR